MTPPMLGCVSQRCSSRLSSQPERSIITGPSGRRAVFIRDEMRKETQLKCRSFGRRGPVLIRRKTTLPSQMIWRKEASLISLRKDSCLASMSLRKSSMSCFVSLRKSAMSCLVATSEDSYALRTATDIALACSSGIPASSSVSTNLSVSKAACAIDQFSLLQILPRRCCLTFFIFTAYTTNFLKKLDHERNKRYRIPRVDMRLTVKKIRGAQSRSSIEHGYFKGGGEMK